MLELFLELFLEFALHVFLCSLVCVGIHYIFHKKVDDKNHKHQHEIDYNKLAETVIDILEIRKSIRDIESSSVNKEEVYKLFGIEKNEK